MKMKRKAAVVEVYKRFYDNRLLTYTCIIFKF